MPFYSPLAFYSVHNEFHLVSGRQKRRLANIDIWFVTFPCVTDADSEPGTLFIHHSLKQTRLTL